MKRASKVTKDLIDATPTIFEQLQEGPAPVIVQQPAALTLESVVEAISAQFESGETTYDKFNAALKAVGIKTIYDADSVQLQSIADTFGVK